MVYRSFEYTFSKLNEISPPIECAPVAQAVEAAWFGPLQMEYIRQIANISVSVNVGGQKQKSCLVVLVGLVT